MYPGIDRTIPALAGGLAGFALEVKRGFVRIAAILLLVVQPVAILCLSGINIAMANS
jgi:hypothetical protein